MVVKMALSVLCVVTACGLGRAHLEAVTVSSFRAEFC